MPSLLDCPTRLSLRMIVVQSRRVCVLGLGCAWLAACAAEQSTVVDPSPKEGIQHALVPRSPDPFLETLQELEQNGFLGRNNTLVAATSAWVRNASVDPTLGTRTRMPPALEARWLDAFQAEGLVQQKGPLCLFLLGLGTGLVGWDVISNAIDENSTMLFGPMSVFGGGFFIVLGLSLCISL